MKRYATPGEKQYNIGQQGRIISSEVKRYCDLPPYLRLVNQCKDKNGFITVQAVEVCDDGRKLADIGNLSGSLMVPFDAILF